MALLELSDKQQGVMEADGNLLVLGGPGSGKTTVAILKSDKLVINSLQPSQNILFLSFARSAVTRIIEALNQISEMTDEQKRGIEIDTYHAFFWRIIRSHGYLLGLPRKLSLLTPPAEAIALSSIRSGYPANSKLTETQRREKSNDERVKRIRLAVEEGKVCFDLFAEIAAKILHGSRKIRELICEAYPFVILDEFQDTNEEQWDVVKALGQGSTIIALADPEQRIYEFIGADPERINHYMQEFQPSKFNLIDNNFRSADTDIVRFGNDILRGKPRSESYLGITACKYHSNKNQAYAMLKWHVCQARKRLIESDEADWSLAVLVPTKKMTRLVSDYLNSAQPESPTINHTAVVESEAAILAAEIISFLLQPKAADDDFAQFIQLVCNFYKGRGGDKPTKTHIAQSIGISEAHSKARAVLAKSKEINKNSLIVSMLATYQSARAVDLTGDPDEDWIEVRAKLAGGLCKRLQEVATESRNLRLLNRGTEFRMALSQCWRDSKCYTDALDIVKRAFVQEHFARPWKPEIGVVVMNMHKAKGKQFDEVIIFEGWPRIVKRKIVSNPDRIVRGNSENQDLSQARQNFRVSITRAKSRTTILTPDADPCVLFESSSKCLH